MLKIKIPRFDIRTSKKKMKDSHWTEPSMSILPHPFIKISYLQRIFLPCMLVTLKVFNICQIPHKSLPEVKNKSTWKNKKISNTQTWIKYWIFGGRNHVRIFEILEEFGKYSNIPISVAELVTTFFPYFFVLSYPLVRQEAVNRALIGTNCSGISYVASVSWRLLLDAITTLAVILTDMLFKLPATAISLYFTLYTTKIISTSISQGERK